MAEAAATTEPAVAIEVRGLVTHYGDREILHGIDMDVRQGEIMVIMGGSGSGKTTLLHLVAGSMVPQVALAAMLIEGVFERHPGLVLIVEELGITWLPHFLTTIDSITSSSCSTCR